MEPVGNSPLAGEENSRTIVLQLRVIRRGLRIIMGMAIFCVALTIILLSLVAAAGWHWFVTDLMAFG